MNSIESGNIKQSIERLMILDFLTIKEIYQRNLFSEEIDLNTGFKKVKKSMIVYRSGKYLMMLSLIRFRSLSKRR